LDPLSDTKSQYNNKSEKKKINALELYNTEYFQSYLCSAQSIYLPSEPLLMFGPLNSFYTYSQKVEMQ